MNQEADAGAAPGDEGQGAAAPSNEAGRGQSSAGNDAGGAQEGDHAAGQPRPGYQPYVDLTGLPDETRNAIEARFDHLSRLVKKSERKGELSAREWKQLARDQASRIDELMNGFTGMTTQLQDKTFKDTEAQLTYTMKVAHESGDTGAYIDAQNKLIDLKAEQKLAQRERKEAPKTTKEERRFNSASEVAGDALEGGEISHEEKTYIDSWQSERDDSGNMLRPWAHNRSNDPDRPDRQYTRALFETMDVMQDDRFSHLTMEQKLMEVDKRMGTQKQGARQNVMGGGLTGSRKANKLTLSPDAQKLAVKMKFGGPKAKSEAEHIEAYRKQIEQSRQKGARQ